MYVVQASNSSTRSSAWTPRLNPVVRLATHGETNYSAAANTGDRRTHVSLMQSLQSPTVPSSRLRRSKSIMFQAMHTARMVTSDYWRHALCWRWLVVVQLLSVHHSSRCSTGVPQGRVAIDLVMANTRTTHVASDPTASHCQLADRPTYISLEHKRHAALGNVWRCEGIWRHYISITCFLVCDTTPTKRSKTDGEPA